MNKWICMTKGSNQRETLQDLRAQVGLRGLQTGACRRRGVEVVLTICQVLFGYLRPKNRRTDGSFNA